MIDHTESAGGRMGEARGDVMLWAGDLGGRLRGAPPAPPRVARCLSRILAEVYAVSVVLEATVGFSRTARPGPAAAPSFDVRVEKADPLPLRMTPLDKKFLRSLKITV